MKRIKIIIAFLSFIALSHASLASNEKRIREKDSLALTKPVKAWLILRDIPIIDLIPIMIFGEITLTNQVFRFSPKPCDQIPTYQKLFVGCYNDLIKEIQLDTESIKAIKRRNLLLIIPNQLMVKTKDGKKYFIQTYQRRRIMRKYKQLKSSQQ